MTPEPEPTDAPGPPAGEATPAGPHSGTARLTALRLAMVLLAAATSLSLLGRQPLWFDEVASAHAAALPWRGLRVLLGQTDANLGAYYAVLHLVRGLGDGALVLRLPSALASIATVVLVERVGRRLIGARPAVLAGVLLAVHPFGVAYARDARPYALVALCCVAALLLGLRAVEHPTPARLLAYAAAAACAVALHLYAVLPIAAYALALLPSAGPGRRRWVAVHAGLAVATLPLLSMSLRQQQQLHWVPTLSAGRLWSGVSLLAGGTIPLLALAGGVWILLTRGGLLPQARVLLLGALGPVAALALLSLVRPTFVPRYLLTTVPVQCLLLAAAGRVLHLQLRGRWQRVAGGTAVATLAVWLCAGTWLQAAAPFHYENYRAASRTLLAAAHPGDAVVYAQQGARLGLDYYLSHSRATGPQPVDALAPAGAAAHGFAVAELTGRAAALALSHYRRVWLVSHLDVAPAAADWERGWRCVTARRAGGVGLALCTQLSSRL